MTTRLKASLRVVYENGFDDSGYESGEPIGGGLIVVDTAYKQEEYVLAPLAQPY